jgi:hypothetical protein
MPQGGDTGSQSKHAPVHRHIGDAWNVGGRQGQYGAPDCVAQEYAHRQAAGCNQYALGDRLPHDPEPPGAQREAYASLMAAADRAHQQQVGYVQAGNQHDQTGGA